jgi:multiple sugar transport system substrate-binding protein
MPGGWRPVCWVLVGWLVCGCATDKQSPSGPETGARPEIELSLLVVEDPAMAAEIDRLRGDWKARTHATLKINEISADELLARQSLDGPIDAIIYPSCQLGPLAQRTWIAPLPADYARNKELAWSDTFELLQVAEATWGQVPYAVPLGSPVLTCFYRADLLERFHKRPPQTWADYHELAAFLARRENLGDAAPPPDAPWFGAVEPLAKPWAGRVLLARAAAYAKHRDNFSTLFKVDTMQPLIDGPPFVRALTELVADAKLGPPNVRELDPAAARREFLTGHAALALSYPSHAGSDDGQPDQAMAIGFVELPGSSSVYNFTAQRWEDRIAGESTRIPLLGFAGRLGSVAQQAAHPENAFQLLAWLSGHEWGAKVSGASPATTLYRRSQVRDPRPWLDPLTDAEAAQQYARSVQDALSRQAHLFALRIPGQEKYLAALETAVEQATSGQRSPSEALQQAATEWSQITDALGLDAQRDAYRKSLNLEP